MLNFFLKVQYGFWHKLLKRPKPQRIIAEATHQPFAAETFNAIHIKDVLVHIPNREDFFSTSARILKPQGKLLIITQNVPFGFFDVKSLDPHDEKYSMKFNIQSADEYIAQVSELEKVMYLGDRKIVAIEPPYFELNSEELYYSAHKSGFVEDKTSSLPHMWEPMPYEKDWAHEKRYVIALQKNEQSN